MQPWWRAFSLKGLFDNLSCSFSSSLCWIWSVFAICYYSHTVPIYEGYTLYHAILRLARRDLSMFLMMNLIERWYSFTSNAEKEIVPVVKEKLCYVCLDFGTEHKSLAQVDKENVYVPIEGNVITLATNVSVARNCCFLHSAHPRRLCSASRHPSLGWP